MFDILLKNAGIDPKKIQEQISSCVIIAQDMQARMLRIEENQLKLFNQLTKDQNYDKY